MSDLLDRAEANLASHHRREPVPGSRSGDRAERRRGRVAPALLDHGAQPEQPEPRLRGRRAPRSAPSPSTPAAVEDPSLILYDAMLERDAAYLVTNGDQTRTVYDALGRGESFESALATREREPDAPNYTPRISGLLDLRGDGAGAGTLHPEGEPGRSGAHRSHLLPAGAAAAGPRPRRSRPTGATGTRCRPSRGSRSGSRSTGTPRPCSSATGAPSTPATGSRWP